MLTCLLAWLIDLLVGCLRDWFVVCLLTCSLARLLARLLAYLLACFFWFALLTYFDLFALLTCAARADERQKLNQTMPLRRRLVEFVVFNLLALVWFELARLVIFLDLLACFTLVWFGWFG